MATQRHFVLYALAAVSALVLITLFAPRGSEHVSYIAATAPEAASSGAQVAPSGTVEEKPAFRIEVVDTPAARAQGLSGRRSIPENYGMLFIFEAKGNYGFWMKDMYVPIDIAWLADDGTVLGVVEAYDPSTYPEAVYPPEPVRYVLETRAGEMRRQGWGEGSRFALPLPRPE